ncbi:ArsR family transcriptional regulator [Oceanidesulfovibrio indonesiensis]|uniref:ArsR family transcriptional regulator n=1 Tax=Oceanidesulfovibrio indonesiensis TaxID=54767 RepID=A0A7M3MDK4_9BACT|nr:metalloregulator ArsR/SmtB family transcription factor [Oceanidesulfovibrio indonesiensis]TVM16681.1 ArsR family transcriptional regulator [Oceanidesulfovibrio indonesiensis]
MLTALPLCKALADETRLRLVRVLSDYELNVNELVAVLGMGQSRISRHLKILADNGLVSSRRDGLWVFYTAAHDSPSMRFVETLRQLFPDAEAEQSDLAAAARALEDRTKATTRFFDAISDKWDKLSREILGDLDLSSEIEKRLPGCGTSVDLGCGTGRLLDVLRMKSDYVIGVDSSSKMLDTAKHRIPDNGAKVSLRIGALEHLPVRDAEADCVVTSLVFHHLSEPRRGVAEAARILKNGGVFIIADYVKHQRETMRSRYGDRWLGFEREEMDSWLDDYGFDVEESTEFPVNEGLLVRLLKTRKR